MKAKTIYKITVTPNSGPKMELYVDKPLILEQIIYTINSVYPGDIWKDACLKLVRELNFIQNILDLWEI